MTTLGPQQQNQSYEGLLQIPGGVTRQLQQVQDGEGNGTGLWLSTTGSNATTPASFAASVNGATLPNVVPRLISDGFGDYVSVKDFGAIGDGVHDDTAAIQAAYDSLTPGYTVNAPSGGGVVYYPPGKYKVSATLSIVKDNVYSVGAGATIKPTQSGHVFIVGPDGETRQFVSFDSIIVDHIATTKDIIHFASATQECKVINCRFESSAGLINNGYGVNFAAVTVAFNNNNLISNTYFRYLQNGIKDGLAQVMLNIINCRFANLSGQAVIVTKGGLTNIYGCNFETCGTSSVTDQGIVQFGASGSPSVGRCSIQCCHFENNGSSSGGKNYDVYADTARAIYITANRFYSGASYPTKTAIYCNNSEGITVINNNYDSYSSGAANIGATNSGVCYFGSMLDSGSEFTATGAAGILTMGFASGNYNVQLGGLTNSYGFAVKDSSGNNQFIAFADGSLGVGALTNGSKSVVFTSSTKPGTTSGASPAGWLHLRVGGVSYWIPAWLD
jgi:hypothetical protein